MHHACNPPPLPKVKICDFFYNGLINEKTCRIKINIARASN